MRTLGMRQVEQVVAGWRGAGEPVEGWESPAGPLFPSGEHAEADLTTVVAPETHPRTCVLPRPHGG